MRVKTWISPGLSNAAVPRPVSEETVPVARRCKRTRDFERYGTTIGRGGCNAITRRSLKAQHHSDRCRKRIEEKLQKTPEGRARLEQAELRIVSSMAEALEEGDKKIKEEEQRGEKEKKAKGR